MLDPLDHFVRRTLGCCGYARYVDDFLLFADDKRTLHAWRSAVINRLARLRLTLHERRCQPRPVTEGIPWLGFVVYPTRIRLKRRKGVAFRRSLRAQVAEVRRGELEWPAMMDSIRGWAEHARHGDTLGLRRSLFAETPLTPLEEDDAHR